MIQYTLLNNHLDGGHDYGPKHAGVLWFAHNKKCRNHCGGNLGADSL